MSTTPYFDAVVIGASAGALEALNVILPLLPADFPLPIIGVVHLPPDRESLLCKLLNDRAAIAVVEAQDKELLEGGKAYFAPPDYHLLIETDKSLSLSNEEQVLYSRPSIDVMFESAADALGDAVIGVVLTGANSDGAQGLKMIMDGGGEGLVQCSEECFSPAMPEAALAACPAAKVMSLTQIAEYLIHAATKTRMHI
ncbi:MAG: chemotaxis protein CheB [Alphaproteobacteria bacterium]|nr:chemotaxis protein CheB [Alphaproteobacteria bacterium]